MTDYKVGDEVLYRVEFQVQRRLPGDEDFTEIGFGSSGGCGSIDGAAFAAECLIERREWETTDGMPDPALVDSADVTIKER